MPLVRIEDNTAIIVDAHEWYNYGTLYEVTEQEAEDIIRFNAIQKRFRGMLTEIQEREEYEHPSPDPYADHNYCSICRECMTCNLRPCRDGGEHTGV